MPDWDMSSREVTDRLSAHKFLPTPAQADVPKSCTGRNRAADVGTRLAKLQRLKVGGKLRKLNLGLKKGSRTQGWKMEPLPGSFL